MTERDHVTHIRAWSVRYRIDKHCKANNINVLNFCQQHLGNRYWYRQSMKTEFVKKSTVDALSFLLEDLIRALH